jgi:hypothetical protein
LMQALRSLVSFLRLAHPARRKLGLLVSQAFDPEKNTYLTKGSFVFVIDKSGELRMIYELRAGNFAHFLRSEFALFVKQTRGRIGAFEGFDRSNRVLGRFNIWKGQYHLMPHAFLQFVKSINKIQPQQDRFARFYPLSEAFVEFSSLIQTSQPIEFRKVASALDPKRHAKKNFRVNGGWLFVLDRENTIEDCIGRYSDFSSRERRKVLDTIPEQKEQPAGLPGNGNTDPARRRRRRRRSDRKPRTGSATPPS